ncbi:hypothetical protein ERJ75_001570900 [Trypanosoma vivax]|nr:hypothetical protein ERJ75_001570900 [Trypanosoma vivax]
MCGPALLFCLRSLCPWRFEARRRSRHQRTVSRAASQRRCATSAPHWTTRRSGARGDGEARTAQGNAGRNLGALTAALEASASILNSSTEVVTLRNHAAATRMAHKARYAIDQLTSIMEATMTAGDAAGKAAAGVKEYMRVLGTVAGKNTAAITCLNKAASLEAGIASVKTALENHADTFLRR